MNQLINAVKRLHIPSEVEHLTDVVLNQAKRSVDASLRNNADVVEILDDVSNSICSILDPMECLLGLVSSESSLVEAASKSIERLSPLLHSINRDAQLFAALKHQMVNSPLSGEKKAVADSFALDFSLYGLDRPNHDTISRLHLEHSEQMNAVSKSFRRRGSASLDSYMKLFDKRGELAQSLGFKNFAEMNLQKNILRKPENVSSLLEQRTVVSPVSSLKLRKRETKRDWNRLDNILTGLMELCTDLFGLKFAETPFRDACIAVKALDHASGTSLGVIFMNLLKSPHKKIGPSYFTLFGSKLIGASDNIFGQSNCRQLPAIYISCNINDRNRLTFDEIQSLFHEFGHALHGILSTTHYQSLSGTRCSLDFAEYPSMLMERLASIWSVFEFMGAPISVRSEFEDFNQNSNPASRFKTQQLIAHTDLMLHTHSNPREWLMETRRSEWIGKIEHFNTYGATYYSYILADVLASKTINAAAKDPNLFINLRSTLLSKGGTVDPLAALTSLGINLEFD